MNLLNGLAVSDTREIQDKAEMINYISRVEQISYAESIVLGDPFGFFANKTSSQWFEKLSCLSNMYQSMIAQAVVRLFTGNRGITLFSDIHSEKIKVVQPNQKSTGWLGRWQVSFKTVS